MIFYDRPKFAAFWTTRVWATVSHWGPLKNALGKFVAPSITLLCIARFCRNLVGWCIWASWLKRRRTDGTGAASSDNAALIATFFSKVCKVYVVVVIFITEFFYNGAISQSSRRKKIDALFMTLFIRN